MDLRHRRTDKKKSKERERRDKLSLEQQLEGNEMTEGERKKGEEDGLPD